MNPASLAGPLCALHISSCLKLCAALLSFLTNKSRLLHLTNVCRTYINPSLSPLFAVLETDRSKIAGPPPLSCYVSFSIKRRNRAVKTPPPLPSLLPPPPSPPFLPPLNLPNIPPFPLLPYLLFQSMRPPSLFASALIKEETGLSRYPFLFPFISSSYLFPLLLPS